MALERSLVFIKPRNKIIAVDIFNFLDFRLGESTLFARTIPVDIPRVPRNIIERHYFHIPQEVKEATIQPFLEQGVILAVYFGEGIADKTRRIIGPKDPLKAGKDTTVRGLFGSDSFDQAFAEKRYLNNVIHASANAEEAEREIELWRDFLY